MGIIHSTNYSITKKLFNKIFIQKIWKLFIQNNYSFFWKIDYRPGLVSLGTVPQIPTMTRRKALESIFKLRALGSMCHLKVFSWSASLHSLSGTPCFSLNTFTSSFGHQLTFPLLQFHLQWRFPTYGRSFQSLLSTDIQSSQSLSRLLRWESQIKF